MDCATPPTPTHNDIGWKQSQFSNDDECLMKEIDKIMEKLYGRAGGSPTYAIDILLVFAGLTWYYSE